MAKEIVFAGGCFWGVEEYFSRVNGVLETKVGYVNGHTENPTYEQVCTNITGHAEACYVKYDEKVVSLEELLNRFWRIINPTLLNRQGPDIGSQYRTGIYYMDEEDLPTIMKTFKEQEEKYHDPIVTEVEPLRVFYEAEEYHQKYLKKNPGGYCHIDLNA
ncbi:MAG: peptide-methionine (S)-S-oxide reductase MsrA [Tissierellia bacterium]|nr:peptide-methionine (S)-S-oxide reductase MsrA [Tissierellia bacterium]